LAGLEDAEEDEVDEAIVPTEVAGAVGGIAGAVGAAGAIANGNGACCVAGGPNIGMTGLRPE
jgi:hypothetical protein